MPAPFGPIRPRISPRLMVKVTASSAARPPNRTVTSSSSTSGSPTSVSISRLGATISATTSGSASSGMHVGDVDGDRDVVDHRADVGARRRPRHATGIPRRPRRRPRSPPGSCGDSESRLTCVTSAGVAAAAPRAAPAGGHVQLTAVGQQLLPHRDQTLRPEDHQHHQGEPEEQVPVLRDRVAVDRDAEDLGAAEEEVRQVHDDERAEDDAELVALAAEHDGAQEQHRVDDVEVRRDHELHLTGVQRAGHAADARRR